MAPSATKLIKAFYHDMNPTRLVDSAKGIGARQHDGNFDLDRQGYITGPPPYWILAVQPRKHAESKTISSLQRRTASGTILHNSTPVVAQILIPPNASFTAEQICKAMDASMEGLVLGTVHKVVMDMEGGFRVEKHWSAVAAEEEEGGKKGKGGGHGHGGAREAAKGKGFGK